MAVNGRKGLSRAARLKQAKQWLAGYRGKIPVRGYQKWFGVDGVCAVVELRMLGVDIPDSRLEQARRAEQARATHRARQREKYTARSSTSDWDDEFAFIAGYTEGGAPYGIRWDDEDEASVHELARRAAIDPVRQAARHDPVVPPCAAHPRSRIRRRQSRAGCRPGTGAARRTSHDR